MAESFEISASNLDNIGNAAKRATDKVKDFERAAKSLGFGNAGAMFRQQPRLAQSIAQSLGFTTPPPIPPGAGGSAASSASGPNWGRALLGTAISPFSPYFGGRILGSSGAFGGGTGFASMAPIIGGVIAALFAFRHAISIASEAVERGSRLYQQSAMTARSPGRLAAAQLALSGIGIDPGTTNRLLLQGQFSHGRGASGSLSQMLLRSGAGAGDIGTMQQIRNMSKELDYMAEKSAYAAKTMGIASGALQRIGMEASLSSANWSAAFMKITADMEPVISAFFKLSSALAKFAPIAAQAALALTNPGAFLASALMPRGKGIGEGPDNQRIAGGAMHPLVSSQWQRLGFTFGNFPGLDYAKETAKNTKAIATAVGAGKRMEWSNPLFSPGGAPGFHMP